MSTPGTERNLSTILIIIIVLVLVPANIYTGVELYKKNSQYQRQIQEKQEQIRAAQRRLKELPELRAEFASLLAERERLLRYVPASCEQATVLKELKLAAIKNKVEITDCTVENGLRKYKTFDGFLISRWHLSIGGQYCGVMGFLESLSVMPTFIQVAGLEMVSNLRPGQREAYYLEARLELDVILRNTEARSVS